MSPPRASVKRRGVARDPAWLTSTTARAIACVAAVLSWCGMAPRPCAAATTAATAGDGPLASLASQFRNPPPTAWPHAIWRWGVGSLATPRVEAELDAMRQAGLGGAVIELHGLGSAAPGQPHAPPAPVDALLDQAVAVARRAGFELAVSVQTDGRSGGLLPLEEAPRALTWKSTRFQGGGANRINALLVPPPAEDGTFEKIVVLAAPMPPPAAEPLSPSGGKRQSPWPRERAIDVSTQVNANGRLEWEAPPGFWSVMQIGSTTTSGMPNWRSGFREAFSRRLGYDPAPLLPIALGFGDADADLERRFLRDVTTALAQEFREHDAVHAKNIAARRGLTLLMALSEGMTSSPLLVDPERAAVADVPLATLRIDAAGKASRMSCCWTASAGHVHGKRVVAARAVRGWHSGASSLVASRELSVAVNESLCAGVNRIYLPIDVRDPAYGQLRPWLATLSRCQWLLQSGVPVVDFCMVVADGGPPPELPLPGYRAEWCTAEALGTRFRVDGGMLAVPEGIRYRALVLPGTGRITPQALEAVNMLARAGATIAVVAKPTASPSLHNHPACDQQVVALANELCGDAPMPSSGSISVPCGQGRVLLLSSLAELPAAMQLGPDVSFADAASADSVRWAHRGVADAEVYFVANMTDADQTLTGTFRVSGMQPQLWNPKTGDIWPISDAKDGNGVTVVPLTIEADAGVFVVFHKGAAATTAVRP